jgi:hypothetical protein
MPRSPKTTTRSAPKAPPNWFIPGANGSADFVDFRCEDAETILPTLAGLTDTQGQIFERMTGRRSLIARAIPEIAELCLEQIRLAYHDLTRTTPSAREGRESAREWIARDYDPSDECVDVASFEGCCITVGIEPTGLRTFLLGLGIPVQKKRGPMPRRTPTIQPIVRLMPPRRGRPPRILVAAAA